MNGLLVRIAVDQAYGGWNAPVDPETGRFLYVPIPEASRTRFQKGLRHTYAEFIPSLESFAAARSLDVEADLRFPTALRRRSVHLDPDFDELTYGDDGTRRGSGMLDLEDGDLVAFYAGLRPIRPCRDRLVYALVGLYVVDEVVTLADVPRSRWGENAHTRKMRQGPKDVIVRAKPGVSGRLKECIRIGEWRSRAYRVCRSLLKEWGGLSVRDGYIQRSAVPPSFLDARRFYRWFLGKKPTLLNRNT